MAEQELNARVTQRIEITPTLIILRVEPYGWDLPAFTAGQFAVLGLPPSAPRAYNADPELDPPPEGKLIRRSYSIASSSIEREYLEFYVALVSSGELTPRLFALGPGDPLWLGPKFTGAFTLADVPTDQHLVLLATGTGLAPYMSMLRSQLECGGLRRVAIVHGARHSWDLGYRAELVTLQRICANLDYLPTISAPQSEPIPWTGLTGYIQEVWRTKLIDQRWGFAPTPQTTHLFVCGHPGMVETMERVLADDGYALHERRHPGQVHVEKYW